MKLLINYNKTARITVLDKGMASQVVAHPEARTTRSCLMATEKSSAAHAHSSTEEHDDTIEAHYSALERLRPHACTGGWVFVGHLVVGDDGEEVERVEALPCRRCAEEAR
jgi:hypothetical protein